MHRQVRETFLLGLSLIGFAGCGENPTLQSPPSADLAIIGAQIINPGGQAYQGPSTILIKDGRLLAIGSSNEVAIADGTFTIDANDQFVIPGLVDLHFHVGFAFDGLDTAEESPFADLKAALAWGVTTVMDPGTHERNMPAIHSILDRENPEYPRVMAALGIFTTLEGYGAFYAPAYLPTDKESARQQVRELDDMGFQAVKLGQDDLRWMASAGPRLMREDIMHAIIDQARLGGMTSFVHAPVLDLAEQAIEAGVSSLAHGIVSGSMHDEFVDLMRIRGTHYMSTSVVFESFGERGRFLDWVEAFDQTNRVPTELMEKWRLAIQEPWPSMFDKMPLKPHKLHTLEQNLRRAHEEGLPIVLGTDVGQVGLYPGMALHQEMALHVRAGLTPMEVLEAGTRTPARLLGREHEFGGIEVGKVADLVILKADPREDITNSATIHPRDSSRQALIA